MLTLVWEKRKQRLLGPEPGGAPGEGGVLLDAVLEEAVEHRANVTAHPVELGADINDHVILQPMMYTMTAGITDSPTTYGSTNYAHPDASLRSKAAWALLVDLMTTREPFTIEDSEFLIYENMVIEGLTSKKNAVVAGAIIFEASLRQLNIVTTSVSPASDEVRSAGQAAAGADPAQENGPAKLEEVTAEQQSALDQLTDVALGGTL